jgi:N6-L-threonylcarbamoyladenine synthase
MVRDLNFVYNSSFSFAGLRNKILKYTEREEVKFSTEPDKVVPNAADLCASFQHAIFAHICKRLQRGMIYVDDENALPKESRTLVVSGGVACNQYFRHYLEIVCKEMGYRLVCPEPKLCTDNGIMIAWNGVERYKAGVGIAHDINTVDIDAKLVEHYQ